MRKMLAFVMISLSFFYMHASTQGTYCVTLSQENNENCDDDEFKDIKPNRRRTPPLHNTCTLDFSRQQICTTVSDLILSYEVWSEDGLSLIVAFENDADAVTFLNEVVGAYQIRLFTEKHMYIGYLEL